MPEPILIAERVRKVYRSGGSDVTALKGLDLIRAGGRVPGGDGAVRARARRPCSTASPGLDEIDEGRVLVDGHSIHELSDARRTRHRAETMGFIFQAFNLIPVFTATENVELPLLLAKRAGARGTAARPRDARRGSASATGSTGGRPSSRAASSSAWRSRAPLAAGRGSSGPTSPPATSTPRWPPR